MGKKREKTTKAGETCDKEQMWVHNGKPLTQAYKTILREGMHSQQPLPLETETTKLKSKL